MEYDTYLMVTGVIREISMGNSCCSWMVTVATDDSDTVNFIVTGETQIIDNVRLRRGMRIAAFYDSTLPVPLIEPPQYRTEATAPKLAVVTGDAIGQAYVAMGGKANADVTYAWRCV